METENKGVSVNADGSFSYPTIKAETTITEEKKEEKTEEVKAEEKKVETSETKVEEKKEEKVEVKVEEKAAVSETKVEEKTETKVEEKAEVNENEEFFEELTPDVINKKLDDYSNEKFGLSYINALAYKNRDIDKIAETNDAALVIEHMQLKANGRLTETEVRAKMAKFDLLFMDDEDYRKYIEDNNVTPQQELDIEAEYDGLLRDAIEEIKKTQASIDFTPVKFKAKKAEPTKPEEQPKKEDLDKALRDVAGTFLKTFSNEEITIMNEKGDETLAKITIEATESDKNKTLEAMPLERWITSEGKYDPEKHVREIHKLENFDKYMKLAYQAGIDKGKKSEAIDVHNAIKEKSSTPGGLKETPKITAADVALANLGQK